MTTKAIAVRLALILALVPTLALPVASGVSASPGACPDVTSPGFRAYLLDCRAYELVTPSFKEGFPVLTQGVSPDGRHLLVSSFGTFANPRGLGLLGQSYGIARTASGWEANALDAPASVFPTYQVQAVSLDVQNSLLLARLPGQTWEDVYLRTPDGSFSPIGPGTPAGGTKTGLGQFMGASDDLSRSLFIDGSPSGVDESRLWPGDTTVGGGLPSLYEYHGIGNSEPSLVGVSDGRTLVNGEQLAKGKLISDCGIALGGPKGEAYNAISTTGEVVYFTANAAAVCGAQGPPVDEVYARVKGEATVPISEPSESDCARCLTASRANAFFDGASSDGAKVFFTTEQELLPGTAGMNLYEYDFDAPAGERVTRISTGAADPDVQGVARVSEDGTHVYFVARGVLTSTSNSAGNSAVAEGYNLYVSEAGRPNPSFIATLSPADAADWALEDARPAQATPDGRVFVFQSSADLTADQHEAIEAGQVFEYDARSKLLTRVSRGQDGYNDDGNSKEYPAALPIQSFTRDPPTARFTHLALSGDGAYVFFSSSDALTPQAVNGVSSVYEYSGGHVALISDGHDGGSIEGHPTSQLIGADESGSDVFFSTLDPLVVQDGDSQVDIYDARIDGGPPPSSAPAPCAGDACQGNSAGSPPLVGAVTSGVVAEGAARVVRGKPVKKPKPKPRKRGKSKRPRAKARTGKHKGAAGKKAVRKGR